MTTFRLRFPLDEIAYWAGRYDPSPGEMTMERELSPAVRARGYLTHDELAHLGRWKSPRVVPRLTANAPDYVEAVTAVALSTPNLPLRVDVLRLLYGVAWPMATVVLHWSHTAPYPILDYRALWSLGVDPRPPYNYDLWRGYTDACRELAAGAGVSMRDLDRALWRYSWEHQ